MVDSIQGMREITAFGRGPDRNEELTEKGWAYAGHLVRFQKSQASQIGFMEAMMGLGSLAVLAMGVWLVLDGQIERTLLPLVSVLALASFNPVTELARTMKQMMETLAASRRILAVHDEPVPVQDGPAVMKSVDGELADTPSIDFEEVAFAYARGDPQALAGVSFGLGSSQTVAIVGRSGRGEDHHRLPDDAFLGPGPRRYPAGKTEDRRVPAGRPTGPDGARGAGHVFIQ